MSAPLVLWGAGRPRGALLRARAWVCASLEHSADGDEYSATARGNLLGPSGFVLYGLEAPPGSAWATGERLRGETLRDADAG